MEILVLPADEPRVCRSCSVIYKRIDTGAMGYRGSMICDRLIAQPGQAIIFCYRSGCLPWAWKDAEGNLISFRDSSKDESKKEDNP